MSGKDENDYTKRRLMVAKSIYKYFRNRTEAREGKGEIRGDTYTWSEISESVGDRNGDQIGLMKFKSLLNVPLMDDLLRFMLTLMVIKHRILSGLWSIFDEFLGEIARGEFIKDTGTLLHNGLVSIKHRTPS